jgi:Kef-type K+ transport system membrane component KefB
MSAALIVSMFLFVRPVAERLLSRLEASSLSQGILAAVFGGLLLSSLAAEVIGIHALIGAFLFGAVIPHDSAVARTLTRRLEDLVVVLLLPAFFAYTGLRTQIGLISGQQAWLLCGLIILLATVGKVGGTFIASRLVGLGRRDAAALGLLMNTRGLMELIALNVGLELQIISPTLYAMMVLMALVTTVTTAPLLYLLTPTGRDCSSSHPDI